MLTIQKIEKQLVRINAVGKLTVADYDRALPELNNLMDQHECIQFLIILTDFKGWELGALWQDVHFDQKYLDKFGRTAIVGENLLEKWGTELSQRFYPSEIRYFESPVPAKSWLLDAA